MMAIDVLDPVQRFVSQMGRLTVDRDQSSLATRVPAWIDPVVTRLTGGVDHEHRRPRSTAIHDADGNDTGEEH